ncbi:ABC transporter ATP-binding protein [Nocardioides humi]|uniref:ABC transporter ATP-binding protein n=1 Tax=Nocardioides humi TaxID=449461 RepID=A0ABN2BFX6_9ACTN|nr:ATP-binding cassette domain-containing protein [Nocardioides humi]
MTSQRHTTQRPGSTVVRCRAVARRFGSVPALTRADLAVDEGEILALVGENGAGKSTLMRIIAGEIAADAGEVSVDTAVGLVRQQLSTVPGLTVIEQIALAAPAGGRVDWRRLRREVTELMDSTGLEVPLDTQADRLPVSLQQRVEILSVIHRGARCLLLDEPTTYLTPHEVDGLFEMIRGLTPTGVSAVFISHKLREVAAFCDRVSVLARGETVATFDEPPFDLAELGRAMTSKTAAVDPGRGRSHRGDRGRARGDHDGTRHNRMRLRAGSALAVAEGEIVGIAGVAGNGQDELVATLTGLRRHGAFAPVLLDGRDVTSLSPWRRRRKGVRLVPSNVKQAAVAAEATLADNLLTARVDPRYTRRGGWLERSEVDERTDDCLRDYGVVATGHDQLAGELSGGNLQKFVVARELAHDASVLIAHEPTRGVDFAAAAQIRRRLDRFAEGGGGVVLLTSDLDELLELSDRVHVLYNGDLSQSFPAEELSVGRLGELLGGIDRGATA